MDEICIICIVNNLFYVFVYDLLVYINNQRGQEEYLILKLSPFFDVEYVYPF